MIAESLNSSSGLYAAGKQIAVYWRMSACKSIRTCSYRASTVSITQMGIEPNLTILNSLQH